MKKKTKYKLIAGVIVGTMILSGCSYQDLKMFRPVKAEVNDDNSASVDNNEIEITKTDIANMTETLPNVVVEILTPQDQTKENHPEDTTIENEVTQTTEEIEEEQQEDFNESVVEEEPLVEEIEETKDQTEENQDNQQHVDKNDDEPEIVNTEEYSIGYTNCETLMRSKASEVSPIITYMELNAEAVRIFTDPNGWDLVKCNEYVGYVKTEEMTYSDNTLTISEEYIHRPHNDIVVTTSTLNFRTKPKQDSERILTFNEDQELQVIATVDNGWLAVTYNGQIGYVHGGYVISMLDMINNIYPELQLENLTVKKIVYPASSLNLRCGSGTDFESLGMLEKYETLRVLGEYDDWYFVMTNERVLGFVNKNYTNIVEDKCIVVDKSCQQLYYYNQGELIYTTEVTTGKDSTPSDTGLFQIQTKAKHVTLTDNETYWSDVVYWLRYNGGEGIHDASWRRYFNEPGASWGNIFGSESYHTRGSHGCINTPYDVVEKIYHEVEKKDKVLVHK